MQIGWLCLFFIFCLFFSCNQEEKKAGLMVQSIRQTGQLVTVEYALSKIIRADDNKTWYKWGNRRILISTEAVVKAGVDLQGVTADDVVIKGDAVRLTVPPPKLFSISIPPDKINVLYEDVSLFRNQFSAAEREGLLRQAEKQIRSLADSLGILKTAETNTEIFLRNLLQQGGYREVTINFAK